MKTITGVLVICVLVTGCGVQPSEVGSKEFDPLKVAYFKDARTEICYAVASYNRIDTSGKMAGGLSHSAVPCTPAVEKLVRH